MRHAHNLAVKEPPRSRDGRRHQRVRLSMLGRCMFEDRREYVCQVVDMSLGGAALVVPAVGRIGERVVAYVDPIGRLEGRLVRHIDGGFAMALKLTPRKQDKLASQLTWIANRDILDLPEDRRHERFVPASPISQLTLADGTRLPCRILDVSTSGAAIRVEPPPAIGTAVRLGLMRGRIVRHTEDSVGVEFTAVQSPEAIRRHFS